MSGSDQLADAPEFVRRFARWWSDPDPDTLGELLAPEVVLRQPMLPATHGLPAGIAVFRRLLDAIPDLRGRVHSWGVDGDRVFIEFTLRGTAGGREISWRAVDRFTLDGDLATERVNYFDPLPLLLSALHPARLPTIVMLLAGSLRR